VIRNVPLTVIVNDYEIHVSQYQPVNVHERDITTFTSVVQTPVTILGDVPQIYHENSIF
jgi:hypothetical protein